MPDLIDQTGLTFGEHLYELAEAVGLARHIDDAGADITSRLPEDEATLDLLKRRWNRGYESFLSGADPLARPLRAVYNRWKFLDVLVEIDLAPNGDGPHNVNRDAARYRLPAVISSRPKHAWSLTLELQQGSFCQVVDVSSHMVMSELARSVAGVGSDFPLMAACRPIPSPDADGSAWEVVVAPRPTVVGTMSAQFRCVPRRMSDLNSKHICGSQHDAAIRAFARLEWANYDEKNPNVLANLKIDAATKLDASVSLDKDMGPRTLGMVRDTGVGRQVVDRAMARSIVGNTTVYVTNGA